MGEKQKRAGSVQPSEEPAFIKPKDGAAPSLRSSFKNDAEALYVPQGSTFSDMSGEEVRLHQTVERYNIINDYLNTVPQEKRDFAQHLFMRLMPSLQVDELKDLDLLIDYISKALAAQDSSREFDKSQTTKFKVIDDFISSIESTPDRELVAKLAPQLLGNSEDEKEMKRVCDFLERYVGKAKSSSEANKTTEQAASIDNRSQVLEALEVENIDSMIKYVLT